MSVEKSFHIELKEKSEISDGGFQMDVEPDAPYVPTTTTP